jgi:hypothetical protein
LIEEGQRDRQFRTDVPADLVVDYFFGSVHHLGVWYRRNGKLSPAEVAEHYANLLLSSLKETAE